MTFLGVASRIHRRSTPIRVAISPSPCQAITKSDALICMSSHHARRRALLTGLALSTTAAVALGLSPAAQGTPTAGPAASSTSAATSTFIVQLASAAASSTEASSETGTTSHQTTTSPRTGSAIPSAETAAVIAGIRSAGGQVTTIQSAIGMLVAQLPPGAAAVVSRLPGVLGVSPDRTAHPLSLGFDPVTQPGSLTNVTRSTGAQALWREGLTGAGVDVALIDTGVAPVPSLADPNKVVVGPDLSFESQDPNRRYLDNFGHGTNMASIIAGRETPRATGAAYAEDQNNFYGMAPDARLISVKVGAHDGAVDVSQLIAAIDWVVQNRNRDGLDIKVLNLSFGTDSAQAWSIDPLSQAAEVAGRAGILVVVAGGNDGERARGLADPAYNPHVLAVGAVDTKGTDGYSDDRVPSFSQHSDSAVRSRQPDLVAPGVGIVASAVAGSDLATRFPSALVGNGFIRGSGTSQAAAVVSGAAALLWQKWPGLSALQIREILVNSSTPLSKNANYEGSGEINLTAALTRSPAPSAARAATWQHLPDRYSTGTGTLQGARGSNSVTLNRVVLTGERDVFGHAWNNRTMSFLTANERAWTLNQGTFNGNIWIGSGFTADTVTVAGRTWNGRTWAGRTWAGQTWSGQTWTGRTWAGQTWSGRTWAGPIWASTRWR